MNEELQNALAQLILSFVESMGGAKDFALEQAPEVIQQLLLWKATISAICFTLGVLLLIMGAAVLRKRLIWSQPKPPEPTDPFIAKLHELEKADSFDARYHSKKLREALREPGAPHISPPDHLFLIAAPACMSGIAFIAMSLAWLQIWLAPKVYLIEYAANLAK